MLASIPDVAQIKMHAYGELRVEGVQSRKPLLQVNDKINQTTPCQSEFSRTFNKDFVSSKCIVYINYIYNYSAYLA